MMVSSSMKQDAPVQIRRPERAQTRVPALGEETWLLVNAGVEKISDPIWIPTTSARQLKNVRDLVEVVVHEGKG